MANMAVSAYIDNTHAHTHARPNSLPVNFIPIITFIYSNCKHYTHSCNTFCKHDIVITLHGTRQVLYDLHTNDYINKFRL